MTQNLYPSGLLYSRDHLWVRLDGECSMLGITHHAQAELGDIVYVELAGVGRMVNRGDPIGTVESLKAVSDLASPIGGTVVSVNAQVHSNPQLLNDHPYTDGWIIRMVVDDPTELTALMNSGQYQALLDE